MKYFDGNIKKGFFRFVAARAVMRIAGAFSGLFIPIFLYGIFNNNFQLVIIFYTALSLIYLLFLPTSRVLNRFGFKKCLYLSIFVLMVFYLLLYFAEVRNAMIFAPLILLTLVLFRLLYWLPYHTDFTKLTDGKNRGRQFSFLTGTFLSISIFVPIVSGFAADLFGINILFLASIFFLLITSYLISKIDCIYEEYSWSYTETWKFFMKHIKDRKLLVYVADGVESMAGLYIWPVFIFLILDGSFLDVGIITSFITAVVLIMQLLAGKFFDKNKHKDSVLRWGSFFYSIGWIAKIFVLTSFEIFIAGVYHSFASIFTKTPYEVHAYEIAADQGHYVDEYTVLREMAVNGGRAIMGVLVFVTLFFTSINWVFLIAAIASLLLNLIMVSGVDLNKET